MSPYAARMLNMANLLPGPVRLEEALMAILPRALAEIDRREQLAREEADAAAMLEDFEPLEEEL